MKHLFFFFLLNVPALVFVFALKGIQLLFCFSCSHCSQKCAAPSHNSCPTCLPRFSFEIPLRTTELFGHFTPVMLDLNSPPNNRIVGAPLAGTIISNFGAPSLPSLHLSIYLSLYIYLSCTSPSPLLLCACTRRSPCEGFTMVSRVLL